MNFPRFLLHGISGVYNYGCEAIVRGTVEILRTVWPNCQIIYLSRRPIEDKASLGDCPLEISDNGSLHRMHPIRVFRGGLRRVGLPYDWLRIDKFRKYKKSDYLISIGGDIFTLGPGPYPTIGDVPQLKVPRFIISKGCKFVLWGASVGPFEAWPQAVPAFQRFLSELTLITVREPVTLRYLESLGIKKNVAAVADPAFLMESAIVPVDFPYPPSDDKPVVGVNLSPLSLHYVSGGQNVANDIEDQISFLDKLVCQLNVRLLLIPHVLAPHNPIDDDYSYLHKIYIILEEKYPDQIKLLPPGLGARRTKGVISRCDIVLAARMHCAIAGVYSGTPTVFIAYSAKAKGMAQYVYGTEKWCVDLRLLNRPETISMVRNMLDDRPSIRYYLVGAQQRLKQDALKAGLLLADKISELE